jgi:beta-galactosidase
VHTTGAEAVVRYTGGPLAGCPAVTRHRFGTGTAWYLSTGLSDAGLARLLADAAGPGPGRPPGLEVVRRRAPGEAWAFVLNHTEAAHPVAAADAGLPPDAVDLVTGRPATGLRVPAGGWAVLHARTG